MKILKYLFFVVLILFIAGSIYVATKDGDFEIESSRIINAPAPLLYREVADLSNWQAWEGWKREGIQLEISEKTKGEGATLSWEAENIRDGKIVTVEGIPNRSLEQELLLNTSTGQAHGSITWEFESQEGQTQVTWRLSGSQSFKDKLAFILQDRDLNAIFEPIFTQNLQDLEDLIIRKMEAYSINVDGLTEHGGGYYMYTTSASKLGEVNTRASKMIEQVSSYMKENEISISGKPFVIYNQRDKRSGNSIFSAAVPTPNQVVTPSGSTVLNGYLEPQKVVKTTLKGNRKNAIEAWEATYRYIEENELAVDPQGQPFEIYLTSPDEVDNPALWITEIYIPVQ